MQYIIKKVLIMYDNNAIEPYNNRGLSQQQNVGENPTVILYSHINRHVETPNTKTKGTTSLDTTRFVTLGSRIGWVSMKKEVYKLYI